MSPNLNEGGQNVIDALKKTTSPSVANAIETFKVRPRHHGNVSSEIRCLFPELGPMVGYAVPCVIRAEHEPIKDHRASTYGWWDYVLTIPAPRVIAVHDLDDPRGQGAQWGEVQANIHRALARVGAYGGLRHAREGGRALDQARRSDPRGPARCHHHSLRDRRQDPASGRGCRSGRAEDHHGLSGARLHRAEAQGPLRQDPARNVLAAWTACTPARSRSPPASGRGASRPSSAFTGSP